MNDERITGIILELEQVRARPVMYLGTNTAANVGTFLCGFDVACRALGLLLPFEIRRQAIQARG